MLADKMTLTHVRAIHISYLLWVTSRRSKWNFDTRNNELQAGVTHCLKMGHFWVTWGENSDGFLWTRVESGAIKTIGYGRL